MTKYSFVTVSNRLPVNVTKTDAGLKFETSSGGLATAMSSLGKENSTWVGWCGIASEELTAADKKRIRQEFAARQAVPVFLTRRQVELYYDGYANDTLWPVFHYFQSVAHYRDDYWEAYQEVNEAFSAAIKSVAASNATVWIQDYHLMLLPALVRQQVPAAIIGFFLHIPFPSFEIYRLLPERSEILRGLLGADVIGFHIYDYAHHFLSSCHHLLGIRTHDGELEHEGRIIRVGTYPIGIDYAKFARAASSVVTKRHRKAIAKRYKGQRLILSVDRLDYSKGILQRLEAFQQLLELHAEYRGTVCLLMIAVPSRTDVDSYRTLRDSIEQAVSRINGLYGTVDWTPISYQFQNRPFHEVVALYAEADVMLVTPIRDGMNLVAKEYVASKQRGHGVLILSEMAGAVDELPEALSINPNNSWAIAKAMDLALSMPKKEQRDRLRTMQRRLKDFDIYRWGEAFTQDLERAAAGENKPADMHMTDEQHRRFLMDFRQSKRRLLLLDYDGTLKPFISSPTILAGFPSLRLRWILRRLSADPFTTVAIVSGRPRKALSLWFRGLNVELGAEHGAWTRYGNGKWRRVENNFKHLKKSIRGVMEQYVSQTKGAEIEEKDYALVWHYRNVNPELAYRRASKLRHELQRLLKHEEAGVFMGDKIIEVKQREINKGRVVTELMREHNPDFVFCAGDDYTDEDMFKALGHTGYTFKIGDGETHAKYRFDTMNEAVELLDELIEKKPLL